jgi:SdpI/YfhL protein family
MDSAILTKMLSNIATPSIFCGILFIVISLPLLRGSIPMNRFYGFRISKAFTSNANWYAINKYGAKALIFWSIVMIASGVLLLFLGLPSTLAGLIPLVICIAVAIFQTVHFARQLKNSNDENPVEQ